ncbi:MAG: response regulator [Planctomycetes bacterium]|nr:response regulator [Planctomycetota bacterium]
MSRILVVDDDQSIAHLVQDVLADEGHEVSVRYDGREAFRTLCEGSFDLLVSDIQMPHEDGLSLLARMRSLGLMRSIPVIFITGRVDEDCRQAARVLGAGEILTKPFSVETLLSIVTRLLAAPKEPATEGSAREGNMDELRVADLCYMLAVSGKAMLLSIDSGGSQAELFVRNGTLVRARAQLAGGARLAGEDAFFEAAGWKGGCFRMQQGGPEEPDNVSCPLDALLVEAAQRRITTRQWRREDPR